MATKKKLSLQTEISSDEDLNTFLSQDGLKVIDAYTEWCGPCKALESTFKRIKTDTSDDLLLFGMANTDKINALKEFNGTTEPCFLFYGAQTCVNVIRGAEGPRVAHAVIAELQKEHDAIENGVERVKFEGTGTSLSRGASAKKRPVSAVKSVSPGGSATARDSAEAEPEKEFTFAIIKPDAIAGGHADAIFAKLAEAGFKVAAQDDRTLTEEEAKVFYAEHAGKAFFENLVTFMTSGPLKPLVLTAPDAIAQWRALLGPTNTEVAKEEAPDSLRALFGTDQTQNAAHGADSPAAAAREVDFFFPDWANEHLPREDAVVIITPDANATETLQAIAQALDTAGFSIDDQKTVQLTEEVVQALFSPVSDELKAHLQSGESVCIKTSKPMALSKLVALAGPADPTEAKTSAPESLRGKFGQDAVQCAVLVPTDTAAALDALFEEHEPENEVSEAAMTGEAVNDDDDADTAQEAATGDGAPAAADDEAAAAQPTSETEDSAETGEGTETVTPAAESEGADASERPATGSADEPTIDEPEEEEATPEPANELAETAPAVDADESGDAAADSAELTAGAAEDGAAPEAVEATEEASSAEASVTEPAPAEPTTEPTAEPTPAEPTTEVANAVEPTLEVANDAESPTEEANVVEPAPATDE